MVILHSSPDAPRRPCLARDARRARREGVIIIGGGAAGCAFALALRDASMMTMAMTMTMTMTMTPSSSMSNFSSARRVSGASRRRNSWANASLSAMASRAGR